MSESASSWAGVGSYLAFGLVRALNVVFDIVTLPIYTILQMPWQHAQSGSQTFAVQLNPADPDSPWVAKNQKVLQFFDGITTVDQLTRKAIERFKTKNCLGAREVFRQEYEVQRDGKTFKKLDLGAYKWMTYEQLEKNLNLLAKGFLSMGIRPRQNVVIFADTRLEWMLAAQALLRINVTVVTLYATLGEEGIVHGINQTESTHLVTSEDLLPKVARALPQINSITHVIYMENPSCVEVPERIQGINLLSWTQLKDLAEHADPELEGEAPSANDTAILMYTSGSTGVPKGVIISHKNIVATARGFAPIIMTDDSLKDVSARFIAYLPLAHVLELAAECVALAIGAEIGYSSPLTLTDRSTAIKKGQKGDAAILRPTFIAAVPLVLDRIKKGMTEGAHARGNFAGLLFDWAVSYKIAWQRWGYNTPILNRLVLEKLRAAVGGKVNLIASGSAPLSVDTHCFIEAVLGCHVVQGYGLTETAAGATIMSNSDFTKGAVGCPLMGCQIKLVNWEEAGYHITDKPNPRGEVIIGGDNVAKGYYKNDDLTRECFREEEGIRWFYTGDIGEIKSNGTIKIIDRKKDLIKLQFGEYISLGKIETELKTLPFVENICVVGNPFHTFLIALISPNAKSLNEIALQFGKPNMNLVELCADPDVVDSVNTQIMNHGIKSGLHKMEIPNKVKLCHEEWIPDSGLVTAALKIRRKQIELFYKQDIAELYGINGTTKSA